MGDEFCCFVVFFFKYLLNLDLRVFSDFLVRVPEFNVDSVLTWAYNILKISVPLPECQVIDANHGSSIHNSYACLFLIHTVIGPLFTKCWL